MKIVKGLVKGIVVEIGYGILNCTQMDDVEKYRKRTGFIHIAFTVGVKEDVDRLTEKIRNNGYEVISEPRTTGDGYYESCILDSEGNQIEITADI